MGRATGDIAVKPTRLIPGPGFHAAGVRCLGASVAPVGAADW